jgi:hypothetical protein
MTLSTVTHSCGPSFFWPSWQLGVGGMNDWPAYVVGAPVMMDAASILPRQKGVAPELTQAADRGDS